MNIRSVTQVENFVMDSQADIRELIALTQLQLVAVNRSRDGQRDSGYKLANMLYDIL